MPGKTKTIKQADARQRNLHLIRLWLAIFIAGLVLSGLTAFPLATEMRWFVLILHRETFRSFATTTHLLPWIERVNEGVQKTGDRYPFLAYGTDWLAFAHLVIAVAFIGPYLDPVRNKWVIHFGLIACTGVIPLALIAGPTRHIPFVWRLVDCSFGVLGLVPLLICRRLILKMEHQPRFAS